MGYVVSFYGVTPGTASRRQTEAAHRTTRLDRAVSMARVSTLPQVGEPDTKVATVSATSRNGRTLLGTVERGVFTPTQAFHNHTNAQTEERAPMATATATETIIALAWDERGKIKTKKEYQQAGAATKFAEKQSSTPKIMRVELFRGDTNKDNLIATFVKGSAKNGVVTQEAAPTKADKKLDTKKAPKVQPERASEAAMRKVAEVEASVPPMNSWEKQAMTKNGYVRFVGRSKKAIASVYIGHDQNVRAQQIEQLFAGIPALIEAAHKTVERDPELKELSRALSKLPRLQTLREL